MVLYYVFGENEFQSELAHEVERGVLANGYQLESIMR